MKKIFAFLTYILFSVVLYAQPVITNIEVSNINCGNDGKITVTATGTGTMGYALIAPSTETRSTQASNVFDNLPAGNYTVAVYDAVGGSTNPAITYTTIGGTYTNITIGSIVGATYPTTGKEIYCKENGRVSIVIAGGKAPYTYKLTGPKIVTEVSSATSFNFDELPSGSYTVTVNDCNSTATSAVVTATSKGKPLSGTTFNTVTASLSVSVACSRVTFSISNISINGGAILLKDYPYTRFRVIYNGSTSAWQTATSNGGYPISFNNYNSGVTQCYIEVEHPCTGTVKASSNLPFTAPAAAQYALQHSSLMYNPCTGVLDSVKLWVSTKTTGDDCTPYNISITCDGKVYTFQTTSPWLPAGKNFTINSAKNGRGENMSITSLGKTIANTLPLTTLYPANIITQWASPDVNCNFDIINSRFSLSYNTSVTENGSTHPVSSGQLSQPVKLTFTLTGGPNYTSFSPITFNNSTLTTYTLWSTLESGKTYTAKLDIVGENNCTYSRNFTITTPNPTYIALDMGSPRREVVDCGVFAIKGKAWLTEYGGATNTTASYTARLYRKGSASYLATYNVVSNSEYTFQGAYMLPGDYVVRCSYGSCTKEYEISVPANSITVDYKFSGGITCTSGGTTKATIFASGGKGTLQYQIKQKGQPDALYTPYTVSNVFNGLTSGEYIVRIKDDCGTTVANVTIQDGTQQFLSIVGSISPGVVCEGKPVALGAYSIGPVDNFIWYKDGVVIGSGPTMVEYIIPSANPSIIGTYKVEVVTGFSCTVSSTYDIVQVAPLPEKPVLKGLNSLCIGQVDLTAVVNESNVTYYWFKDGVQFDETTVNTVTVFDTGSYSVIATPFGFCPSDTSNVIKVTEEGKLNPLTITGTGDLCSGFVTLTADDPMYGTWNDIAYLWMINYRGGTIEDGDLDFDDAIITAEPTVDVGEAANYCLLYIAEGGCISEIGPIYTVAAKSCLTLNDDYAFVFACESIEINILNNDLNPDAASLTPTISAQGTLGVATIQSGNKALYTTNAGTCAADANKIDQFKYEIIHDGTTYDALVTVNILEKPVIVLPEDCSDNPRLALSRQYPGASYVWEYSADNGSTWNTTGSDSPELPTTISGQYRVKITYKGATATTIVKTLTITKQSNTLPGGKVFYEVTLI